MRLANVKVRVYEYHELSEKAKEHARNQFIKDNYWEDNVLEQIKMVKNICSIFNIELVNYYIQPHQMFSYKLNGVGYDKPTLLRLLTTEQCIKWMLLNNNESDSLIKDFINRFTKKSIDTGNCLLSFKDCINLAFQDIVKQWEYAISSEYIDDFLSTSEIEFFENGEIAYVN